mmetsp:Transcript_4185/g.8696  ORF Transcript_4185/g.8696 Transcript_4185/m.8696 type:complete len:82 (+) Transcript_4185:4238-4483(+)
MSAVLKTASVEAIFDATERSLETNTAIVKVLQMAKRRQMRAFASDLPASSAPDVRPAFDLFINLSPMNIVKLLDPKSAPTT